jgi:transposase-like protein
MSMLCDYCKSINVVKKGFRHNASGKKQKYFCNSCKKWFVEDDGFKRMRNKPEVISRAIHQYADGLSLGKVKNHLKQHDSTKVTRWTIRKWVVKYESLLKKNSHEIVFQRLKAKSITTKKEFT